MSREGSQRVSKRTSTKGGVGVARIVCTVYVIIAVCRGGWGFS